MQALCLIVLLHSTNYCLRVVANVVVYMQHAVLNFRRDSRKEGIEVNSALTQIQPKMGSCPTLSQETLADTNEDFQLKWLCLEKRHHSDKVNKV